MKRPISYWTKSAWIGCLISLSAQALDLRLAPSYPRTQLQAASTLLLPQAEETTRPGNTMGDSAASSTTGRPESVQTVVIKPVISGFLPTGCANRGSTITIQGNGFDSAKGKAVALSGNSLHLDLTIASWTVSTIVATMPNNPRLLAGKKYFIAIEKAGHAGWLTNTNKTITICGAATPNGLQKNPIEQGTELKDKDGDGVQDSAISQDITPPSGGDGLLGAALPPAPQNLPLLPPKDPSAIEPGELIAISPSMAEAQTLAQQVQPLGLSVKRRTKLPGLGLVVSVLRVPKEMTVGDALTRLRALLPKVWADANHRYELLGEEVSLYGHKLMGWTSTAHCGQGLRIGLLDSAVDAHHPALRGRAITSKSFVVAGVTPAPADHGTATAALLVAHAMPSGLTGLLPSAQLYAANIFRNRAGKHVDTTAEWIALALDWLAGQDMSIVNMSLGGPRNLLVEVAVLRLQERGIAVVAAAGNGGEHSPPVYPAAQQGVVAVTAVDAKLDVYRKATRGDYIVFSAPGVDIWTASPDRDGIYVSGTSYATPFVTAALANARLAHPNASWPTLQQQLQKKARDLGAPGKDPVFGWGLVQASGCAATQ